MGDGGLHEASPVSTRIAAFDFDGTVTARDTILPFLLGVSGAAKFAAGLPRALPVLCAHVLGRVDPTDTKEALFLIYLRGRRGADVRAAALQFARQRIPKLLRRPAVRRLNWHQARGDRCFIVTASPEMYVAPWAATLGIEALGSRLEVDASGFLTGRHDGPVCTGPEKVRRLRERIGSEPRELYAYGDSAADRELLAAATHSYLATMPNDEDQ